MDQQDLLKTHTGALVSSLAVQAAKPARRPLSGAERKANRRNARRSTGPKKSASKAKDNADAEKWYRKAAEQGSAEAQNNLGLMCVLGRGVRKDDAAAVKWFRKAAEQGYAPAQNNLAEMRRQGRGATK